MKHASKVCVPGVKYEEDERSTFGMRDMDWKKSSLEPMHSNSSSCMNCWEMKSAFKADIFVVFDTFTTTIAVISCVSIGDGADSSSSASCR